MSPRPLLAQMRRAFQQARVDVEDVPGKGLASGRPTKQQRELAIGACVLREVVVDDQHVAARLHEMFGDTGRRVRCDVGETRRVVALGHDDDGVVHRAVLAQLGDDLGDGRGALADGAVDAHDILAALVENGVERDGCLARAPVAENQLPLSATDWNQRVDDFEPVCSGAVTGARSMIAGAGRSMGRRSSSGNGALAIQRPAKGIDDASEECRRPPPHP